MVISELISFCSCSRSWYFKPIKKPEEVIERQIASTPCQPTPTPRRMLPFKFQNFEGDFRQSEMFKHCPITNVLIMANLYLALHTGEASADNARNDSDDDSFLEDLPKVPDGSSYCFYANF